MRVLLIEDDQTLADSLVLFLKKHGFNVDHSLTGEEGLEFIDLYNYELILLDLILPDMSGDEVLQKVRKLKKDIPILILSGIDNPTTKINNLNTGADDYITKPFNSDELLARITAIIRRSRGFSESAVPIDNNLVVNLTKQSLVYKDNIVDLTKKEYFLFELLALRKGTVVDKATILDQLYSGLDEEPERKIIDVFVCKVRKKVANITNKNYIKTIWGRGYMIE